MKILFNRLLIVAAFTLPFIAATSTYAGGDSYVTGPQLNYGGVHVTDYGNHYNRRSTYRQRGHYRYRYPYYYRNYYRYRYPNRYRQYYYYRYRDPYSYRYYKYRTPYYRGSYRRHSC